MSANEQHTLERYYAYSMARSNIECYCRLLGYNKSHRLEWDSAHVLDGDAELRREVEDAIAYLDNRGLILRPHADNPAIIVIRPNDEERRAVARENDMSIAA